MAKRTPEEQKSWDAKNTIRVLAGNLALFGNTMKKISNTSELLTDEDIQGVATFVYAQMSAVLTDLTNLTEGEHSHEHENDGNE